MNKYIVLFSLFGLLSCNQKSKTEKAVEEIPVTITVDRFDQAFFNTKPEELNSLIAKYPFFFPENTPNAYYTEKLKNADWQALHKEVEKQFGDFGTQTTQLTEVFQHIKFYFPNIVVPKVYTVIADMDANSKAIYANDKLIIALELYLGKDHKFYDSFPEYLRQNFEADQIMPDVVSSFAYGIIKPQTDNSFISLMIQSGKELYLKDLLIPSFSDEAKIGYTKEQIDWSVANESEIWRRFIEDQLLFSTDSKLASRFINPAPFSKFYLEIDNETPGRLGQYIGWQIVKSFVQNNPEVSLNDLLAMDGKELFEKSKYKPKQ
jgi:gliding motility-associated lipoprotein GldB